MPFYFNPSENRLTCVIAAVAEFCWLMTDGEIAGNVTLHQSQRCCIVLMEVWKGLNIGRQQDSRARESVATGQPC